MTAVDQAREIFRHVPFEPGQKLYKWFEDVAGVFRLSPRQVRKIHYGHLKRIDADTMDRVRLIHEERLTKLKTLRELADDNQRRINELIFRRHEDRSGENP